MRGEKLTWGNALFARRRAAKFAERAEGDRRLTEVEHEQARSAFEVPKNQLEKGDKNEAH